MNLSISQLVEDAIATAAQEAQAHLEREEGVHYAIEDLQKALTSWLEFSVEELADEAMYHCLKGDPSHSFNRDGFKHALKRCRPAHTPQEADQLAS